MSDDLYRKEAIEHQQRRLYGDVILKAPPTTWLLTFILIAVAALIFAMLFLGRIETPTGSKTLFAWLIGR